VYRILIPKEFVITDEIRKKPISDIYLIKSRSEKYFLFTYIYMVTEGKFGKIYKKKKKKKKKKKNNQIFIA
jgi:hypothetical protein